LRTIVELKLTSVDQLTYSEFVFSLENPTCFNLINAAPLEGQLILDINLSLLFPIIDRLLGGGSDSGTVVRRPLTEIEQNLMRSVVDRALRELEYAYETLVRVEKGRVVLRPIAGTRRRGRDSLDDDLLAEEMLSDPKERAEHVMLIDLARNDVGRVARTGTVRVPYNMTVERFSHVMHIVSEVEGQLDERLGPWDVVRATFPAGTLTGAPKVRAMQIIRELEGRPRGAYGGALGYVTRGSDLDLAICIRTVVMNGDRFEVTAGAGVVADSVPELEAKETRNKARAALAAVHAARARR
jgi:hypothetical protein